MSQLQDAVDTARGHAKEIDALKSGGDIYSVFLTREEKRAVADAIHLLCAQVEHFQKVAAYEADVVEAQTPESNYFGIHRKGHMLSVVERLREEATGVWAERHNLFGRSLDRLTGGRDR